MPGRYNHSDVKQIQFYLALHLPPLIAVDRDGSSPRLCKAGSQAQRQCHVDSATFAGRIAAEGRIGATAACLLLMGVTERLAPGWHTAENGCRQARTWRAATVRSASCSSSSSARASTSARSSCASTSSVRVIPSCLSSSCSQPGWSVSALALVLSNGAPRGDAHNHNEKPLASYITHVTHISKQWYYKAMPQGLLPPNQNQYQNPNPNPNHKCPQIPRVTASTFKGTAIHHSTTHSHCMPSCTRRCPT